MGFREDLAELVQDPAIRGLALRRARSRELAEDALQDTFYAVAQTGHPEAIEDLRAFFCKSLIHMINRQLSLSGPVLAEDISTTADKSQVLSSFAASSPASVESEAQLHILAEAVLTRLDRDRAELMTQVPGRSGDPRHYRYTIVDAAGTILRLLLRGPVAMADWNAVLQAGYPQWCDEPELPSDAIYQRLSRARADVKGLLRLVFPRDGIAFF
jgi:hypothetical protein